MPCARPRPRPGVVALLTAALWLLAGVAAAQAAVTIMPVDPTSEAASGDVWNAETAPPEYTLASDTDSVIEWDVIAQGGEPVLPLTTYAGTSLVLATLPDGSYVLRARDAPPPIELGAARPFTIDSSAAAPVIVGGPPDGTPVAAPPVGYTADAEAGATVTWTLAGPAGERSAGTGASPTFPPGLADGSYALRAVATDTAGNPSPPSPPRTFVLLATPPGPATLAAPGAPTNDTTPVIAWTVGVPAAATYAWAVSASGAVVSQGVTAATEVEVTPALPDGAYVFSLAPLNAAGVVGSRSAAAFTVDATPPGAPTLTLAPATLSATGTGTFAWAPAEPGGAFRWQVLPGGAPTATGTTQASVGPLAPGDYSFQVRQVDAAGNVGDPSAPAPFRVTAGGTAPTPAPGPGGGGGEPEEPAAPDPDTPAGSGVDGIPETRNAVALRPAAGSRIATVRPTLRWPERDGATRYNVQIFRVDRDRVTKVVTAFPRASRYTVPAGRLVAGRRYIWRVWPFRDGRFPEQPLGVSFFDVVAGAGTNARERGVTLSVRQLRINQRIAQAAVRRVNALRARVAGDPPPTPPAGDDGPARFALSAAQLRINQRISQAAVRRVNALAARIDGDPPPRPPADREAGRVTLSARQLLINQRISQAAVRRVNALTERVEAGAGSDGAA